MGGTLVLAVRLCVVVATREVGGWILWYWQAFDFIRELPDTGVGQQSAAPMRAMSATCHLLQRNEDELRAGFYPTAASVVFRGFSTSITDM